METFLDILKAIGALIGIARTTAEAIKDEADEKVDKILPSKFKIEMKAILARIEALEKFADGGEEED